MGQGFRLQERSVLHFNVADFAVAVEQVNDASLRGRPLLIALQASRAVVYDMSEEAYREGVRKGMPLREATRLCRKAAVLPPRLALYQKAMAAFFKELQDYSPLIECGRVDGHFFVDVTGTHRLHGLAPDIGWRVRRTTRASLGINPIWTLGTSKLIAKVASRLVKPVGEYIVTPGEEEDFLAPLPVAVLPGLTPGELEKMRDFRLTTVGALAGLSRHQLMVPFGARSDFLHDLSRGIDETQVSRLGAAGESLDYEEIFAEDTNDRQEVERVLGALAGQAGMRLRERKLVARRVGVWLRYSDGAQVVRQASCKNGTAADFLLRRLARDALQRAWLRRTRIRSCRLVCDRLQRQSPQLPLFPEPGRDPGRSKVLSAMDTLRHRFGQGVIGIGVKDSPIPSAGHRGDHSHAGAWE